MRKYPLLLCPKCKHRLLWRNPNNPSFAVCRSCNYQTNKADLGFQTRLENVRTK